MNSQTFSIPRWTYLLAIVALIAVIAAPTLAASHEDGARMSDVVKARANGNGAEKVDVIAIFHDRPGNADRSRARGAGATITHEFQVIPAIAMRVPARALKGLAHNPNMSFVALDAPMIGTMDVARKTAGDFAFYPAGSAKLMSTVRDEFAAASYGADDGTAGWTGGWIELDPAGSGPTTGNVLVTDGMLRLTDRPNTGTMPGVTRTVDLSSAMSATLSLDVATSEGVEAYEDRVTLEISPGAGQPFTTLEVFETMEGAVSDSRSYDISAYATAETTIRIKVSEKFGGPNEYFFVDNLEVAYMLPQGSNVTVAVLDSGFATHDDLSASNVVTQVDFTGANDPTDLYGHGTHISGIVAGRGTVDGEHRGVAPGAKIVSLKVLDENGVGYTSGVIRALDWVLANQATYGIDVINMSLGHPVYEPAADDPLVQAAEMAWNAGIVVVASAGNAGADGHGTITSPGNSPRIITVGSLTDWNTLDATDDATSTFSSRGPTLGDRYAKPDLIAPGNRVVSLRVDGSKLDADFPNSRVQFDPNSPPDYYEMSGTSMAAAMVSGTAALMLEKEPTLDPDSIKARLMRSAAKVDMGDPFATGAGILDIQAALGETGYVSYAASPKVFRDEATGTIGVEDTAVLWSDSYFSLAVLWSDAGPLERLQRGRRCGPVVRRRPVERRRSVVRCRAVERRDSLVRRRAVVGRRALERCGPVVRRRPVGRLRSVRQHCSLD